MNNNNFFGERIRTLRMEMKITLRKFATMIEVTPTYVSKIERGEAQPPAEDVIKRMANILQCDVDDLINLAGKVPSDLPAIIMKQPVKMAIMLRTAQNLNPDDLEAVLKVIKDKTDNKQGSED